MATSIQNVTKGFSREAVEELAHRRGEPDWLLAKRIEAWEAYERIPMPRRTDEEWRRTDIRDLPIDDVAPFGDLTGRVASRVELPVRVQADLQAAGELS